MSNVSRNEMLVGVDIGTSKVVAIVAEARGGQLEIIGLGTHSSKLSLIHISEPTRPY